MYLEKLEIQGFKSFANKNKLIFSGLIDDKKRGLTSIVGPNGSGKSNVADAIRWALGEQSLKTLRGKKSEDVIFSGSDQKNQLSLAEVSLYLNNAAAAKNRTIVPELIEKESDLDQIISGCPEIIITRRLYRSGESEYLLNNNRVRLADIQMLLAKANFGQKTYSVIGQGMVENFLTTSAAERKDFFDEATGVKQFQIKRDSALNKLENSYENLQQVDMLLSEIKPRLKSLTRQVEKLKRRGEIENELRDKQLAYYGWLSWDINKKLDSFNQRFLENEKIKIEREKKLDKLNEELNKIRATDNFREMNELQPRLKDLENQKNQYLKQLAKLQAELEIQLESQGQFDVSWLNNKQGELNASLENINSEIDALVKNSQINEELSWREALQAVNREIDRTNQSRQGAKALEEERSHNLKQLSRLDAVLEANLEVQGQFDVSWLNNKNEELKSELKNIQSEIAALRSDSGQAEKNSLDNRLKSVQQKLERLNQEMMTLNQSIKKTSTDPDKSRGLTKLIEEFLKTLDSIGQETDINQVKTRIAAAKKDFTSKIEVFLKGDNNDSLERIQKIQKEIISATEEKQEISSQLNEERLRLSLSAERIKLLEDKKYQLTREAQDIEAKLSKVQIKFDASRIEEEKTAIKQKISQLDQKLDEIGKNDRLNELQDKKQSISEKIQDCRFKSSSLEERRRLLQDQKSHLEKEIIDIKNKLSKSQIKFDASKIETEKAAINQAVNLLNQEIRKLSDKWEELNQAKEKEKGQMFECQKNIQSLQQEIADILGEMNRLRIEAARQETKLEDLEANIRNEEISLADLKNYPVTEEVIDIERWQKNINSYKSQLEQIGGIDPEAEKEYQETKERYDFLSGQTADLNKAIKSLEEIIYELDLNIKNRFDSEFKVISEKFNDYFKILFNGGSAKIFKVMIEDLEKEEAKNNTGTSMPNGEAGDKISGLTPAEMGIKKEMDEKLKRIKFLKKHNAVGLAGIEIQAIPPGKKIQTVTMLSGGERALTAIALISAIISANPSPFVVLDEVDAALDEANSERLAQILDDLSNKTQFIVITHNRACMRKASILYGVTMETDGVSKLLSVKLDDLNLKK